MSSDTVFSNSIKEISTTLLDESTYVLGSNLSFLALGDEYIFVDKQNDKISRFSKDGYFVNEIGHKGKGSQEYLHILNVQICGDTIVVFSLPDKIIKFDADGNYISSTKSVNLGQSAFSMTDDDLLTYHGYSGLCQYRIVSYRDGKERLKGLPYSCKVLSLSLENDRFYRLDNDIFMLDDYSAIVYKIVGDECLEHLTFDFGKYEIKPDFFKFSDPVRSAEYLMSSEYALIYRYICDSRHQIVQVNFQPHETPGFALYGYAKDGMWKWFSLPDGSDDPVHGPFRFFKDGWVYCLFDSEHATSFFESYADKLNNPELVNEIKDSDAHVIAKIRLD